MALPRATFPRQIQRSKKRAASRGDVAQTPLHVRTSGPAVDEKLDEHARRKLTRKLQKFAAAIERATVRFEDVNGPRGGVDTVARIKIVLRRLPSIVVEERGLDPRHAFDLASSAVERAVRRSLGRAGFASGRAKTKTPQPARTSAGRVPRSPPEGSLIGRRVGRSAKNLARTQAWVDTLDTSEPGVSASDRKAGGGSTAARNVKLATSRATATLEDSATGQPSRKSTRKSANRVKSAAKLTLRAKARANSPKQVAERQKARLAR